MDRSISGARLPEHKLSSSSTAAIASSLDLMPNFLQPLDDRVVVGIRILQIFRILFVPAINGGESLLAACG